MKDVYIMNSIDGYSVLSDRKNIRIGVLMGIALNANFLAGAISNVISISNIYIYILVFVALLAIVVNRFKVPLLHKHLVVVLIIAIQLIVSKIFVGSSMTDRFLLCFVGVGLPCLIVTLYPIDIDAVLKTIVISSLICVPYYYVLFGTTYTVYNAGNQMGIAYSILPSIMATIILFFRTNNLWIRVISTIVGGLGFLVFFRLMTRGAYLCVFVFAIGFIYLLNQDKRSKKIIIILTLFFLVVMFFFFFGEKVLSSVWFYRLFGAKEGNILNGREKDFEIALVWRGFDKFLIGAGIGSFRKYEYSEYIHNILGQVYYEQGIYSVVFVVVIIIKAILAFFKNVEISKDTKSILLLLFCMGFVRLMVSYYFWIDQNFWLLVWLLLSNRYKKVLIDRDNNWRIRNV